MGSHANVHQLIGTGNVSGTTWSWTVTYAGMDPANAYLNMYYFSMEDSSSYGTAVYFNISDAAVRAHFVP